MNIPDNSFSVDKSSAVPIYTQLASWIESMVTTGEWPPDYRLPGEIELAKQLSVSRGTLRKAISKLIDKNLLVQIHGKGTFVSPFVVEQTWAGRLVGVYDELMLMGIPFTTRIIEQSIIPAPTKEAEQLGLKTGEPIYRLKRLRMVENAPLVVLENYLDANRYQGLLSMNLSEHGLMEVIEKLYGLRLAWASHSISVIRAGAEMAALLQIGIGDPILFNEHVVYNDRDEKALYSKLWFRSDRYRLRTVVQRGANEAFYSAMSHTPVQQTRPIPIRDEVSSEKIRKTWSLSELLPAERIKINATVNSPEDAIRLVGKMMVDSGAVEPRYVDGMLNMSRQLGPYIVIAPGVALPHARPEDGVLKPCLALATLDPPATFGNPNYDPVRLVFAIGAVDAYQHIDALRSFATLLSETSNLEALLKAQTVEEILRILDA